MKKTISTTLFIDKNKDLYFYFQAYIFDYNKMWLNTFYNLRDRKIYKIQDTEYRSEIMKKYNTSNRNAKVIMSEIIASLKSKLKLRKSYYNIYNEKLNSLNKRYDKTRIRIERLKVKIINNEYNNIRYYKAQKRKLWALANKINRYKQKRDSALMKKIKYKRHTHQISYIGSHEEKCHNQQFQVQYDKKHNCFYYRLRKDNNYIDEDGKYIYGSFYLKYLKKDFIKALDKSHNKPISYKIIYKNKRLYLYITFEVNNIDIVTRSNNGVLGVDFNKGFISVSETDKAGNLVKTFNINYIDYKHKGKNKESMFNMINKLCIYALDVGKDIVIEDLDFTKKKSRILKSTSINGRKYNYFLVTFPYKRFSTLMKEQCLKHGIGLGWVNPAYTSKLGAMLQNRMKLNIHNLAAFVIARRYIGFDKYKFKKKGI